jgi:hypothetical protein
MKIEGKASLKTCKYRTLDRNICSSISELILTKKIAIDGTIKDFLIGVVTN